MQGAGMASTVGLVAVSLAHRVFKVEAASQAQEDRSWLVELSEIAAMGLLYLVSVRCGRVETVPPAIVEAVAASTAAVVVIMEAVAAAIPLQRAPSSSTPRETVDAQRTDFLQSPLSALPQTAAPCADFTTISQDKVVLVAAGAKARRRTTRAAAGQV